MSGVPGGKTVSGVPGGKTVSGVPGGKNVSRVPGGIAVFQLGWQNFSKKIKVAELCLPKGGIIVFCQGNFYGRRSLKTDYPCS